MVIKYCYHLLGERGHQSPTACFRVCILISVSRASTVQKIKRHSRNYQITVAAITRAANRKISVRMLYFNSYLNSNLNLRIALITFRLEIIPDLVLGA